MQTLSITNHMCGKTRLAYKKLTLASSWCSRLTLLCLYVHESIVADSNSSESVQTCEVSLCMQGRSKDRK